MRSVLIGALAMGLAGCGALPLAKNTQEEDLCGARALQDRVGHPVQDFDFGPEARVLTEESAVTLDFRLERLNVVTDAEGVILKIECG